MKKILVAFLLLIILALAAIYTFIPGNIIIRGTRIIATTSGGFDTCLHNPGKWKHWWPGQSSAPGNDSLFVYSGHTYKLSTAFSDGGIIQEEAGSLRHDMRIRTIPQDRDSIVAEWETVLPTSNSPFTRLSRYIHAESLKKDMQIVFDSLCSFAGKTENIYGFPIKRTTFTEVILIAHRFRGSSYPATDIIYATIGKLRQYIKNNGASEKYYPMMNSKQIDSAQYETMIAISIDKMIPGSKDFFISQMVPMKDRFLETAVTGGQTELRSAYNAIEKYMSDHSLSSPARPFEILVTDRNNERDTAKWITKIFYPSM